MMPLQGAIRYRSSLKAKFLKESRAGAQRICISTEKKNRIASS